MSKHTKAAEGQPCIRCGIEDGTTVLAHYQGVMSSRFGKGLGIKGHDVAGAWLCAECHGMLDGQIPSPYSAQERAHELAICCLQTVILRYERGELCK